MLTVRDASDRVVRRLTGPAKAGFHRVAWDLRYPSVQPWKPKKKEEQSFRDPPRGTLVVPGHYSVSLAKREDGVLTDLDGPQTFEVVRLTEGTLPGASAEEVAAFARELAELQRRVQGAVALVNETATRLTAIKEALMRSTAGDTALDDEARALDRRLQDLKERLSGNERRGAANDPGPVSITRRLSVAAMGTRTSTYGPTPTHRESVGIARDEFAEVRRELDRLIEAELPALEKKLDAAGVPWTPGRGAP